MRRLAVLLSALALTCALAVVAAPAAAADPAVVDAGTFSLPIDTVIPCGVGGEFVHLVGVDDYHFAYVVTPTGGSHWIYGVQSALTGVGLTTGMTYQFRGTFNDSFQLEGAAYVIRLLTNARLVGPNGQPYYFLRVTMITVDGNVVRNVQEQLSCA